MDACTASDGTRIAYRTFGRSEDGALDVLLVHGWMVSGAVWDDVAAALGPRRVVVPDLRGTGASGGGAAGTSLWRYADDVLAAAGAAGLGRDAPFHVVGHSMGGPIAILVAAKRAERLAGLTLLTPVPLAGLPLPADAAGLFRGSGGDRAKQGTILGLACKTLPAAARERLLDDAGRIDAELVAAAFDAWSTGLPGVEPPDVPTLVVGTDDPFLPPAFLEEHVVRRFRRARFEHLAGPGHYPQVEAPAATAALLARGFAAHEAALRRAGA